MLEDLSNFNKPVQIVLTKIDEVKSSQNELKRIVSDTSRQIMRFDKFVNPELHLTAAEHGFGVKELRARIGIAFEENLVKREMKKPIDRKLIK